MFGMFNSMKADIWHTAGSEWLQSMYKVGAGKLIWENFWNAK